MTRVARTHLTSASDVRKRVRDLADTCDQTAHNGKAVTEVGDILLTAAESGRSDV